MKAYFFQEKTKQTLIIPYIFCAVRCKISHTNFPNNVKSLSEIFQRIIAQKVFFLILFFQKKRMPAWQGTQRI